MHIFFTYSILHLHYLQVGIHLPAMQVQVMYCSIIFVLTLNDKSRYLLALFSYTYYAQKPEKSMGGRKFVCTFSGLTADYIYLQRRIISQPCAIYVLQHNFCYETECQAQILLFTITIVMHRSQKMSSVHFLSSVFWLCIFLAFVQSGFCVAY